MEKLTVNYEKSGVKALRILSSVCAAMCPVFILLCLGFGLFESNFLIPFILIGAIFLIIVSVICTALSTITENALFQREVLKREYEIIEEVKE